MDVAVCLFVWHYEVVCLFVGHYVVVCLFVGNYMMGLSFREAKLSVCGAPRGRSVCLWCITW